MLCIVCLALPTDSDSDNLSEGSEYSSESYKNRGGISKSESINMPPQGLQIFMDRSVQTVPELWQEWNYGRHGRPPMKSVNASAANLGEYYTSESSYRFTRKRIIDYIEIYTKEYSIKEELAVNMAEQERKKRGFSLHAFSLRYCTKFLPKQTHQPVPQDTHGLQFFMDRSVQTVPELWKEWHHGINGRPPMKFVSRTRSVLGDKYRAETKFCRLRRVILDYVDYVRDEFGLTDEQAVARVEAERLSGKKLTLNSFSVYCRDKLTNNITTKQTKHKGTKSIKTELGKRKQHVNPPNDQILQVLIDAKTVPQLWKEWHDWINGLPPLKLIHASFGIINLLNERTTKFLENLWHIIVYIEWLQELNKHVDLNTILSMVENERVGLGLTFEEMGSLAKNN